jgi:hypothetical protein
MRGVRVAATLVLGALCGCYRYHPAQIEDVQPPMRVRALLSPEAFARVAEVVPVDGRTIEGEVLEHGNGELLLLVPVTSDVVGARVETLHQRLRVPAAGILDVERRELDRLQTGLVLGAGVVVATSVVIAALEIGGRSDRPGGPQGPLEIVIPIGFSLRLGR